jgi:magnesium transporter
MIKAICHTGEGRWVDLENFSLVSDMIAEGKQLVWAQADLADLTQENITLVAEELGLHSLAVEDAMKPRQRPKLETYEKHLFVVSHQLDTVNDQLEARQIASFVGGRFVLTIHQGADRTLTEAFRRLTNLTKTEDRGASAIVQSILDAVVDDYQVTADRLEEEIEALEDLALGNPQEPLQNRLYGVKQQTARLRRYVVPGERVLADVVNGRTPVATERTRAYFQDIHDHLLRIGDEVRNIEDLANAVVELQRSEQTTALNEVTKRLTGWAAIIAIPTLIASVYGMNFRLLPRNENEAGFLIAIGMMAATAVALYTYFKRRDWI